MNSMGEILEYKQFQTLFALSRDGVCLVDKNGLVAEMNRAGLRLFGFAERQWANTPLNLLLHKKGLDLLSFIRNGLLTRREVSQELKALRRDGVSVPVRMRAAAVPMESGSHWLITLERLKETVAEKEPLPLEEEAGQLVYRAVVGRVATGVLHNIGNLLNSVNIGVQNLAEIAKDSKIPELNRANELFARNLEHISEYLNHDPAGKHLPEFYMQVGDFLAKDYQRLKQELDNLQVHINMVKELIAAQQCYARQNGSLQYLNLVNLIEDAIAIEGFSLSKHQIEIQKEFEAVELFSDRAKVFHIFLNLIKNAKEALVSGENTHRVLKISLRKVSPDAAEVRFCDNGPGFSEEHRAKLFSYGFTTKPGGHGFGLYTCRQTMLDLGGSIEAIYGGPGAEFLLTFPIL